MDRRRPRLLLALLLVASAAAACGGSDDETSTTTTVATPESSDEETTTTKAVGQAQVDLDVKGTYVLQIHEQAGTCTGGAGKFRFSMTGDDVDGIGEGFSVEQLGATDGSIEWTVDASNAYESSDGAELTFSSDGTSVQIDDDLRQLERTDTPRPVHVTGTITCS